MKTALLLGAGFGKNWGGWIAREVFDYLLVTSEVRADANLRNFLLSGNRGGENFEDMTCSSARTWCARAEVERRVGVAFARFPILKEREKQLAGTLSGGEQQMLAIARALISEPRLLLLDEPSLGLSPKLASGVFDVVREINRQGVSVLLVEQNVHNALAVATRAYVIETGRVVAERASGDLLNDPVLLNAYMGG